MDVKAVSSSFPVARPTTLATRDAVPTQTTTPPEAPKAADGAVYISPVVRYDQTARLAVLFFRDAETGETRDQIPRERVLEEYRKSAALQSSQGGSAAGTRGPSGAPDDTAGSEGVGQSTGGTSSGDGGGASTGGTASGSASVGPTTVSASFGAATYGSGSGASPSIGSVGGAPVASASGGSNSTSGGFVSVTV